MRHPRAHTRNNPLDSVKSDWGYVTVRENAHMFWWFYFQDPSFQPSFLPKLDPIPVVVWLQVSGSVARVCIINHGNNISRFLCC